MKNTPGPWKLREEVYGCKTIGRFTTSPEAEESGYSENGFIEVCYTPGLADETKDNANAQLIAAAPVLLKNAIYFDNAGHLDRAEFESLPDDAEVIITVTAGALKDNRRIIDIVIGN